MGYADSVIGAESGGNLTAKNPRSSAYGPGQFINSTFLSLIQKHRPDLAQSMSQDQLLALRADPNISKQMVDAYGQDNGQRLSQAGVPDTPSTRYLAHFAGPAGAIAALKADPSAPVEQVLGQQAIAANPFLQGKTAADLVAFAGRKVGGDVNTQNTQNAQQPAPPAPPAGLLSQPAPTQPEQQQEPLAGLLALAAQQAKQQPPAQQQSPFIDTPAYRAQQRLAQLQFQPQG